MKREAYTAARTVSPKVHAYFARHLAQARNQGEELLASLPSEANIEAVIDAAFWASLRREEGFTPRISLAFLSPAEAQDPMLLERPLALAPGALTRVAPAVERPGVHLGVWCEGDELWVWGTTRTIPKYCFVLEVAAPGLLVVKHHSGEEAGKFVNVTVLEGDAIKVVDQQASSKPDCPALVTSLLGFASAGPVGALGPTSWCNWRFPCVRTNGRGGCLLVVPADGEAWRESILTPLAYAVSPPFAKLAQWSEESAPPEELARTIEWIAGLTAVDGAVVINNRHELLGFGAKIARRKGSARLEQVTVTEPVKGAKAELVHPEELGGNTPHLLRRAVRARSARLHCAGGLAGRPFHNF